MDFIDLQRSFQFSRRLRRFWPMLRWIPFMRSTFGTVVDKEMIAHDLRVEAMIQSMTPAERRHPDLINLERCARIADGSGTEFREVKDFISSMKHWRKRWDHETDGK